MEVWPAIDIRGGRCVRLREGDFNRETVFDADPVEVAARWKEEGARRLHIVDLDGAREGQPIHQELVERIVARTGLPVQLGGGIRDTAAVGMCLKLGVVRAVVGTRAVEDPEWLTEVAETYPQRVVLGLDARKDLLASRGWLETTGRGVLEYLTRLPALPLAGVVYTDIARDGVMQGPNLEAIRRVAAATALPVIASGGVSRVEDVEALSHLPIAGAIIGRALYEGTVALAAAMAAAGDF